MAGETLRCLKVRAFTWNETGERGVGLFAQEAHAVFPHAVFPHAVRVGGDDVTEEPWQMDYSMFVAPLIAGWQELDARLSRIEKQLTPHTTG